MVRRRNLLPLIAHTAEQYQPGMYHHILQRPLGHKKAEEKLSWLAYRVTVHF